MTSLKECINSKKRIFVLEPDVELAYDPDCNEWIKTDNKCLIKLKCSACNPLCCSPVKAVELELKKFHEHDYTFETENDSGERVTVDFDI